MKYIDSKSDLKIFSIFIQVFLYLSLFLLIFELIVNYI